MGIIVNKPVAPTRNSRISLVQLDVIPSDEADSPAEPGREDAGAAWRTGRDQARLRAALTADFFLRIRRHCRSTTASASTATLDILRAIAIGCGPENAVLALGYAGWAAGQLEAEIQSNGWLHCAADAELLFDDEPRDEVPAAR